MLIDVLYKYKDVYSLIDEICTCSNIKEDTKGMEKCS